MALYQEMITPNSELNHVLGWGRAHKDTTPTTVTKTCRQTDTHTTHIQHTHNTHTHTHTHTHTPNLNHHQNQNCSLCEDPPLMTIVYHFTANFPTAHRQHVRRYISNMQLCSEKLKLCCMGYIRTYVFPQYLYASMLLNTLHYTKHGQHHIYIHFVYTYGTICMYVCTYVCVYATMYLTSSIR